MGNSNSVNSHEAAANRIIEWVWYEGTDALMQGEGVCYNTNYGTAADADGRRCNRVERPSASNNQAFAGVAARDYSAKSTGQFIEINVPGSKGVLVAMGANTTIDTGMFTFQVGGGSAAGRFVSAGFLGRGSIIPRQTVSAAIKSSSMVGGWSLANDGITLTASTHGLAAGDTVVILGSETNTVKAVADKYTVASVTDANVVVLAKKAFVGTAGGSLAITGYAYTGNPKCQADLLTGQESGGVEYVAPPAAGEAGNDGTEMTYMVGGITYVCGGMAVGTGDPNGAVATPVIHGLLKGFRGLGTITTSQARATLATAGLQGVANADPTTALAAVRIDAANEVAILQWNGIWVVTGLAGATLA